MRHPETDESFREELCTWFRANGVDPSYLPMNPHASVVDGQLTFRQAVLSQLTGSQQMNPASPFEILTEVRTVPVLVEPSADVAEWLRPKCQTCGR